MRCKVEIFHLCKVLCFVLTLELMAKLATKLNDNLNFYFISENIRLKNIGSVIFWHVQFPPSFIKVLLTKQLF